MGTSDVLSPYEQKTKVWAKQIAQGIEFLHEHGIAHRDIKMMNVVLVNNEAKLIDFDMARSYGKWERHFETQELVGTKSLMSPECAYVGNPARAKSNDVQCETSF